MKNIKTFESHRYEVIDTGNQDPIKKYGEEFSLSNLSAGDIVTYLGTQFVVDREDDYTVVLKKDDGSTIKVNQNMFNQNIGKDNVPAKMM